jgi:hypothetical protein
LVVVRHLVAQRGEHLYGRRHPPLDVDRSPG